MSDFMSSATAITICKVNSTVNFTLDALRTHAFTPDIDADGGRLGWVAPGDPLDTDGFELAAVDARYSGFSFRLDTRKASGAVIRIQLAEAVREERFSGKKVGSKRKEELKEAITAKLTARAEFVPSVIDCGTPACRPSFGQSCSAGAGAVQDHVWHGCYTHHACGRYAEALCRHPVRRRLSVRRLHPPSDGFRQSDRSRTGRGKGRRGCAEQSERRCSGA